MAAIQAKCPYCGTNKGVEVDESRMEVKEVISCRNDKCLKYFVLKSVRTFTVDCYPIEGINQK